MSHTEAGKGQAGTGQGARGRLDARDRQQGEAGQCRPGIRPAAQLRVGRMTWCRSRGGLAQEKLNQALMRHCMLKMHVCGALVSCVHRFLRPWCVGPTRAKHDFPLDRADKFPNRSPVLAQSRAPLHYCPNSATASLDDQQTSWPSTDRFFTMLVRDVSRRAHTASHS